jgi:ABC-type transporter Mla subunit MlaD
MDYELKKEESDERLNEIIRIRNLKPGMESGTQKLIQRSSDIEDDVDSISSIIADLSSASDSIGNSTVRDRVKTDVNRVTSEINSIKDLLDKLAQAINEVQYYERQI